LQNDGSNGPNTTCISTDINTTECIVPMATISGTTYLLPYRHIVQAKARAHNQFGWGDYSDHNTTGAKIQSVPEIPDAPTRGTLTSESQIELLWTTLDPTKQGDSTMLSYSLEVFRDPTWEITIGFTSNSLATRDVVSSLIVAGNNYKFRIRAKNIHGWGAYSAESTIRASDRPDAMSAVTTANVGNQV
jgi:hypothetical protein